MYLKNLNIYIYTFIRVCKGGRVVSIFLLKFSLEMLLFVLVCLLICMQHYILVDVGYNIVPPTILWVMS